VVLRISELCISLDLNLITWANSLPGINLADFYSASSESSSDALQCVWPEYSAYLKIIDFI